MFDLFKAARAAAHAIELFDIVSSKIEMVRRLKRSERSKRGWGQAAAMCAAGGLPRSRCTQVRLRFGGCRRKWGRTAALTTARDVALVKTTNGAVV